MLLGLLTVLAVVQLALAVAAFRAGTADERGRFRLPLPDRVAAIAAFVEQTPPERLPLLKRTLDGEDFRVDVVAALPVEPAREDYPVPPVARAVERYVSALGEREVIAWIAPDDGARTGAVRFQATRLWSDAPLRLAVALDGPTPRWLLVETRDRLPARVFGVPPGFWAGVLGVLVALLSLLVLWRGFAPLVPLARQLGRFARAPEPHGVPERGVREVRGVIRTANDMQRRIADLLAERRAMFGALGHDLRTYLARMSLRIEGIADESSRARARRDLDEMEAMIDGALAFAGFDGAVTARAPTDLATLVEEIAAERGIAASIEAGVPELLADRSLLKRAVGNILDNAERHAGGGELVLRTADDEAIVEVLDRGPGIAEADIDRLLRPFERGDTARTLDVPGSGLGLAIVERVATLHGGRLELAPRPGGGQIVRLVLPVRRK